MSKSDSKKVESTGPVIGIDLGTTYQLCWYMEKWKGRNHCK